MRKTSDLNFVSITVDDNAKRRIEDALIRSVLKCQNTRDQKYDTVSWISTIDVTTSELTFGATQDEGDVLVYVRVLNETIVVVD